MKYQKAIMGGTFDHFHNGHTALLDAAFSQSQQVTIGLTTEKFYKKKVLAEIIESYKFRKNTLENYLLQHHYENRGKIIELTDIYGPALHEKDIQAIFVTEDTLAGAKKINEERVHINFPPLQIEIVPFLTGSDNQIITSERIRLGEIDQTGYTYSSLFIGKNKLRLPQKLRESLREPIGKIISSPKEIKNFRKTTPCMITVGDIVTLDCLKMGIKPDISIVDFKTRRQKISEADKDLLISSSPYILINEPGTINSEICSLFSQTINNFLKNKLPHVIVVTGEEDLLTLPAILLSPLGTRVIYGQYNIGAISVVVTPAIKQQIAALLEEFTSE